MLHMFSAPCGLGKNMAALIQTKPTQTAFLRELLKLWVHHLAFLRTDNRALHPLVQKHPQRLLAQQHTAKPKVPSFGK